MNQDAFRQLLTTESPSSSRVAGQSTKKAVLDSSKPAFQPRKVKKKSTESEYRDRASERRAGINEYAHVESVLEDFEQRTADLEDRAAVEEQRRYLGGDNIHTILVKGVDLALLEQNKARAAALNEDDNSLEVAFQEAQSIPAVPKKRTREDLIRELKEQRATGGTSGGLQLTVDDTLERAKRVGRFRPIGAPEGPKVKEKSKKAKGNDKEQAGERLRKKRRKVIHNAPDPSLPSPPPAPKLSNLSTSLAVEPSIAHPDPPAHDALPERGAVAADDDVDIFADAGEYEGIDLGDDDDDILQEKVIPPPVEAPALAVPSDGPIKSWFKDKEPSSPPTPPPAPAPEPEEAPEPEQSVRLAPLASSALPSISDFLAMDAQAEAQKKRRAKKEKKKGGEKKEKSSTEVKVDRDYKKLDSFMAKKGSGPAGV